MADANLDEFYGRIARIEKARAMGYGHEAPGALGRSYFRRPKKRQRGVVLPVLLVLMTVFGVKGAIHNQIGNEIYQARVDRMLASDGFEYLGGLLMKADPATLYVSEKLSRF